MKRAFSALSSLLMCLLAASATAAPAHWVEGKNYTVLEQPQHTNVPAGKVEVMEVFSYGCPACNGFQPVIEKLKRSLPANAQLVFLPASFKPAEDWRMFQRAYFAAQALGVAEKAHQGMFDAVWKTGELAVVDPATNRLKQPQPSIEDAARCYGHLTGVRPEAFLAMARSFGVDFQMRAADAQVIAMQVPGTPCIVVAGKYRVELDSLSSAEDVIDIVRFLVSRERT
jgi:protein dithiol oxidoreductase (disulfide-forming)